MYSLFLLDSQERNLIYTSYVNLEEANPDIGPNEAPQLYGGDAADPKWLQKKILELRCAFGMELNSPKQLSFIKYIALHLSEVNVKLKKLILDKSNLVLLAESILQNRPIFISDLKNAPDLSFETKCWERAKRVCLSLSSSGGVVRRLTVLKPLRNLLALEISKLNWLRINASGKYQTTMMQEVENSDSALSSFLKAGALEGERLGFSTKLERFSPEEVEYLIQTLHIYKSIDVTAYHCPEALKNENPDWKTLKKLICAFKCDFLDKKPTEPNEIKTRFLALVKENSEVFFSAIRFERNKERWLEEKIFPTKFEKAIELARLVIHRFQISQQLDKIPGFKKSKNKITDIERAGEKPHAIKLYFGREAHPEMRGKLNMFFEGGSALGNYVHESREINLLIDGDKTPYDVFYTMVHELVHYISRWNEDKKALGFDEQALPETKRFNEALTEKLARIIVTMNLDAAARLPGYPSQRKSYQKEIDTLNSFKSYLKKNRITERFLYGALLSDAALIEKFYDLLQKGVYTGKAVVIRVSRGLNKSDK